MTIYYVDFDNGNDANAGTSFALRKKTLSSAASVATNGDTIRVMASPDPTSLGQNATFTTNSDTVTLTTAVTANIDTCETAWTASTNVTATTSSTTYREGTNAASLAIAAGFTTGLVAYHAMSSTDFSAYKQVSFWIRSNGAVAAGVLTLTLCSDTAGATAVDTLAIPALAANYWHPVVVDTGAALGAAIQSVALNALSDPGGITVYLDNIIACKDSTAADSLTHGSLIGKNTGSEPWMAIDSINGTTIKLGGGYHDTASRASRYPYYYGATATTTIYKREPIVGLAAQSYSPGGSMETPKIVECGWDRTAMTTQNGLTFYRTQKPSLYSLDETTNAGGYINKWYSVGCAGAVFNNQWRLGEFGAVACTYGLALYQTAHCEALTSEARSFIHCTNGVYITGGGGGPGLAEMRLRVDKIWGYAYTNSVASYAIQDVGGMGSNATLMLIDAEIRGAYANFYSFSGGVMDRLIFRNINQDWCYREHYAYTTKVTYIDSTIGANGNTHIYMGDTLYTYINQGGDSTNHKIMGGQYTNTFATITSDTSTRHTASDYSWKITPSAAYDSYRPISKSIAKIACVANEQRTVKLWFRRDNTAINGRLRVKGGWIAGIAQDVVSSNIAVAADTWEELTLQFTPTQQGVVEVFADAWGGNATYSVWIDDLTVS